MQIIQLPRLLYTVNTEPVKADYAYLCFIERTAIVGDMFSSVSSSCFVREFRLALDICLSIANGEDVGEVHDDYEGMIEIKDKESEMDSQEEAIDFVL